MWRAVSLCARACSVSQFKGSSCVLYSVLLVEGFSSVVGYIGGVNLFYISNEGLSLVENSVHLGLPVPDKLKEVLEQLHDRESTDMKEDK